MTELQVTLSADVGPAIKIVEAFTQWVAAVEPDHASKYQAELQKLQQAVRDSITATTVQYQYVAIIASGKVYDTWEAAYKAAPAGCNVIKIVKE